MFSRISTAAIRHRVLVLALLAVSACADDEAIDDGTSVGQTTQSLVNSASGFVATWETTPPAAGVISAGTYAWTQVDDTTAERLTEAKVGGKMRLDHTWKITDITGTGAFRIKVIASKVASGGDTFRFTWAPATGTGATATCGTDQPFTTVCDVTSVAPAETTCTSNLVNPPSVVCIHVLDSILTSDGTADALNIDHIGIYEAVPPSAVTDLSATALVGSKLSLTWTSPGDDGNVGRATSYDLRYSTSPITDATWAAATQVTGEPTPVTAGGAQTFVLAGLSPSTTYYLALTATDDVGNVSALSNVVTSTTMALPDVVAEAFTAPATIAPGQLTNLTWTGRNAGAGDAVGAWNGYIWDQHYYWWDRVYVSTDATFSADDVLVGTYEERNVLPAGGTYSAAIAPQFPAVPDGAYYIFVVAEKDGLVVESNEANNISAALPITVARGDLSAEAFTAPTTVAPGQVINLTWTGRNAGPGVANGAYNSYIFDPHYYWWDRVYVSTDATFSADDVLVGSYEKRDALAGGGTYPAAIGPQFPAVADGNYYLLVVVDKDGLVSESNEANNATAVLPITVARGDLTAEAFTAPATVAPGQVTNLTWTGRNAGPGVANGAYNSYIFDPHYYWWDRVYVSTDATFSADDVLVGSYEKRDALAGGGTYAAAIGPQFPSVPDGNYYLLVVVDKDGLVSESNEANNATAVLPINVTRSDLVVDTFTAPVTVAPGEVINLSWTGRNAGTGVANGAYNSYIFDPHYYWWDRVYVSTDATFSADDVLVGSYEKRDALAGGGTYAAAIGPQFPAVAEGQYYLLVVADKDGLVSETNEANNVSAARPISVGRADLVAEALTAPATVAPGEVINLSWTGRNAGAGIANGAYNSYIFDPHYYWWDRVYVSTDATFSADDVLVGSYEKRDALAGGGTYAAAIGPQFPSVPDGNYYLLVVADKDGLVSESNEANNVSAALPISVGRADLVAGALTAPATIAPGEVINLSWIGRNIGAGVANGAYNSYIFDPHYYWWDRVYVSTDATFSADDVLVGSYEKRGALAGGGMYTAAIGPQFPAVADGSYYLLVVADKDGLVSESNEANNVSAALPINVGRADLVAEAFTGPATVAPGEVINLSWIGRNIGAGVANGAYNSYIFDPHYYWWDRVYVSTDATFSADDVLVGSYEKRGALAGGGMYTAAIGPQFPVVADGSYYLLVVADKDGLVSESNETNNVSAALPINVGRADLVAEAFTAPATIAPGEVINLSWTGRNAGAGVANGAYNSYIFDPHYYWWDRVYVSTDATFSADDVLVGSYEKRDALAGGGTYAAAIGPQFPNVANGSYYVFVVADKDGLVSETSEANNVSAARAITVVRPDLVADSFTAPSTVAPGQSITLGWTVHNAGTGVANGAFDSYIWDPHYYWWDRVYASYDAALSADDVLVGSAQKRNALVSGASYSMSITATLPGTVGNAHYLIVVPDADALVSETNEANNAMAVAISAISVDPPMLSLGAADWSTIKSPSFAPDSGRVVATDGSAARIWELGTFTELAGFVGHTATLDSATFAPSGAQVLTSGRDGTAVLWDTLSLATVRSFTGSTVSNPSSMSRDGSLALLGNGASPLLYRVATGELVATLSGHTETVTAVALSPDGTRAVTASLDNTARIWSTTTGALLATLTHPGDVNDVAVSPLGDKVATACADGRIYLWTLATGAAAGALDQGAPVAQVDYSGDGAYLVTGEAGWSATKPAQAYLWDLALGRQIRGFSAAHESACPPVGTCTPHNMNAGSITGLAFSPDRTMVAMTQGNGRLRLFATGLPALAVDGAVALTVGTAAPVHLTANQTLTFRVPTTYDADYVVRFAATAAAGTTYAAAAGADPLAADLRVLAGAPPTPAAFDDHAEVRASFLGAGLPLTRSNAGFTYVTLQAPLMTAGALDGTLTIEPAPSLALASVSPRRVGNTGAATIVLRGTRFDAHTTVTLVGAGGATVTRRILMHHDRLAATFSLAGTAPGTYAITVTDPSTGATSTLSSALQVEAGTAPTVSYWIDGPPVLRAASLRQYTVRWSNAGNVDAPAPLLALRAPAGGAIVSDDLIDSSARMLFAGVPGYPSDVIPAGMSGSYTTLVRMPPASPGATTTGLQLTAAPSNDTSPFPWATLRASLPESSIGGTEWTSVYDVATASIGSSWSTVRASLTELLPYIDGPATFEELLPYAIAYHAEVAGTRRVVAPSKAAALTDSATTFAARPVQGGPASSHVTGIRDRQSRSTVTALSGVASGVSLLSWTPTGGFVPATSATVNPSWPTVNMIHGSFTDINGAGGAYIDAARAAYNSYGGNVNITFSDWSSVASPTSSFAESVGAGADTAINKVTGGFAAASDNAEAAGRALGNDFKSLGLNDVVHVAHSHGRFVADGIASVDNGPGVTHGLIETSPGHRLGSPGNSMDYGNFKSGSARISNGYSPIDDHGLSSPHNAPDGNIRAWEPKSPSFDGPAISNWHAGGPRYAAREFESMTPHDFVHKARAGGFGPPLARGWARALAGSVALGAAQTLLCSLTPYPNACNWGWAAAESFLCACPWPLVAQAVIDLIWPVDPEQMVGPGPDGATVSRASPWSYDLTIWNHADATAPVQKVTAFEYLDPQLDGATLQLGSIQYGERVIDIPDGVTSWSYRDVPVNDGCSITGTATGSLAVNMSVTYDAITGRLEWRLEVIDTATGVAPVDPHAGFLPPPDDQLCGRAHLTYAIRPLATTANGSAISASATVAFDDGETNTTNALSNVVAP